MPTSSDGLNAKDYTVEKVYFEAYPGFFTTGNLYRPKGKKGTVSGNCQPARTLGQRQTGKQRSRFGARGRCINFAKQGYVIFSYDMVGRVDSGEQIDHMRTAENAKRSGA